MSPFTRLNSYQGAEKEWQNLLSDSDTDTLFITHDWQRIWWELFGEGAEMLLLGFKDDTSLEGIAPLARRDGTISLIGGQDLCDYNDFLVLRGAEPRFYPSLLDHLKEEVWNTLELSSIRQGSPTLEYFPELARQQGYAVQVLEEGVAPGVNLPSTWETYLQGLTKKDRHELRRKLRRFDSVGDDFRWYKLSDPSEVESNLEDFIALMKFAREDKRRFLTQPRERFFRRISMEMARACIFKLFFLEFKGERVATTMCFDYGLSRLLYNSGFNPAYGYYSVGLVLKALCIKDAIEEGKSYFDFLRGPEPYKYDLGGKDRTLYQIVVTRD